LWYPRFHYANSTRWFFEVPPYGISKILHLLCPSWAQIFPLFSNFILFHRSNIPRMMTTLTGSWIIKNHVVFLDYQSFTGKRCSPSDSAMQSRLKFTGRLPTTSCSRRWNQFVHFFFHKSRPVLMIFLRSVRSIIPLPTVPHKFFF
jgi:hypothetical protein